MGREHGGFTIIEVILFLAISGMMITAVLIGVGASLNYQRYNDALNSFSDFVKGQYNLTDNVRNNRSADVDYTSVCRSGLGGSNNAEGTSSNCTLVGRYIYSTNNGTQVVSRPLIATAQADENATDIGSILNSMKLVVPPAAMNTDDEDYTLAWQTTVRSAKNQEPQFSMLIVRLESGVIQTFANSAVVAADNLSEFWSGTQESVVLCVMPEGLVGANPSGITVSSRAVTSSGVTYAAPGQGTCGE